MNGDTFVHVEAALQRLAQLADELLEIDSNNDVRLSVERLRAAFADREQMEPAVAGVVRCVQALAATDVSPADPGHNAGEIDRLNSALQAQVLPELRRIGFEV